MPTVLLVDNGSTRANATLQLRRIAENLGDVSGEQVHPVSLQHADKISADELDGIPAQTFTSFLEARLSAGEREFIVLPLFFGKSRALTSFIPDQVVSLKDKYGVFYIQVTDEIYPLPEGEPHLVNLIDDHVRKTALRHGSKLQHVVLVDHGSPVPEINVSHPRSCFHG